MDHWKPTGFRGHVKRNERDISRRAKGDVFTFIRKRDRDEKDDFRSRLDEALLDMDDFMEDNVA